MFIPDLSRRDRHVTELMDDPGCDVDALNRTYAQFRFINAVVAGWQLTYLRHLRPLLSRNRTTTLLDIGSGCGDVPRTLARWAARNGFPLQVTAIDPDPRAHAWAMSRPPMAGLEFQRAFSHDLVAQGRTFDLVTSNHMLHHLDTAQFQSLLIDSQRLARTKVVHSDIARSRLAYHVFSVGTRPFFHRSFIRGDGLISIRRSYTAEELRRIIPPGWRVESQWPYRNLLIHEPHCAGTP